MAKIIKVEGGQCVFCRWIEVNLYRYGESDVKNICARCLIEYLDVSKIVKILAEGGHDV